MARKSDTRRRRITATKASRSFSSILDQVERGARFVVRRRGRDVCVISPPEVEGRRLSECIAILRGRPRVTLDGRFGHDLMEILKSEVTEDRSPWDS